MIAFPAVPPEKGPAQQHFELERVDYVSPDTGGRLNGVTAGFPRWQLEWTLGSPLPLAMTAEWRAFIALQRGLQRWFYAGDKFRILPRYHVAGRPFAAVASSWSHAVDGSQIARLTLHGLLPGQIVGSGDYVGFVWSTWKRALVRAQETAVANASGVATFVIEPVLPSLVPSDAVARLKGADCLMKLLPDTKLGKLDRMGRLAGGTIMAVQDLVA